MSRVRAQSETAPASAAGVDSLVAGVLARTLRLCLLELPRIEDADGRLLLRLSAKDAALLALIAIDGPVAGERVAALLWPLAGATQAGNSLRQRLFRIKREVGRPLVATDALLRLADDIRLDTGDALGRIAHDAQAGREKLLGDLSFDDLPEFGAWLHAARAHWNEQRRDALAAAAACCESEGRIALGLVYAQRLVDDEPLAEHAQRRLMRLHYLRGDRAAAIAAFERFESQLKDELGARPSAETIELLRTIEGDAAALPARRSVVPASLLRPPRLIGRSGELAALARAWASERSFVLQGEAGIGKSRLLHEFVNGYAPLVQVQARPGDRGVPYALLARALRAVLERDLAQLQESRRRELALVLPELGGAVALAGEAQRLLLQRAVEATLAAAAAAGLKALIVDDLHFADRASLEMLQSLVAAESLGALRWGFAQRPGEASDAAAALCHGLQEAHRLEAVALLPLNEQQVGELIDSLQLGLDAGRLAPALLRHTGGNPLFVLETLKDLVLFGHAEVAERLPQPTTVGALIERRLAQLSPAALKLARAAALAGEDFSADLAAAVLDAHPLDIAEPWRELEAAQVIRDGAFAHDLVLEATQRSVPAPIAQLLHRRIAVHLDAQGATAARTARHWAEAGEWLRAGNAYVAAARAAQRASQRAHEVEAWQSACECFDRAGEPEAAFDARCDSVESQILVRGVERAREIIEVLLNDASNDRQRAAALTARSLAALMAGDHAAGLAAAREAYALAARLDSPWPKFEAARLLAVGLAQADRATEGLGVIEPFRECVERDGSLEQRGRFWADYAYVLNSARRLRETAAALGHAIDNAQLLGDLAELATLTSNLATVKVNLGRVREALAIGQRARALQAQIGATDGPEGGVIETNLGNYSGALGLYREALAHLDAATDCFKRDGQVLWIAVAANYRAQFFLDLGQVARARQALAYATPPVDFVRARGALLTARIEQALGHAGGEALQQAQQILGDDGDRYMRMHVRLDLSQQRPPEEAAEICAAVQRTAAQLEYLGIAMRARLLRIDALRRAGDVARALPELRELLPQLADVQPADMYLPQAYWIAMQTFDAGGDAGAAGAALAHGVDWIRRTALPHVPEEFHDSFLDRNPVNRSLLTTAMRRLAQ